MSASRLDRSEWLTASLLTAAAVIFHFLNYSAAGGLWRDEAAGVYLATMPSLAAIWSHLEHESFPLAITLLIRAWSTFGANDATLRALGLVIGLLIVAALWWCSWQFSKRPPLLSLLLFALSPTVIRWGDSLRGYGLGIFCILLTLATTWRALQTPTRWATAAAMICGMLAVQTLYQNAIVLLVICLSGVAVAAWDRNWRQAATSVAIGVPAALSLLPYRGVIARANEWNVATQVSIDFTRIWLVAARAFTDRGPLVAMLWVAFILAALASGVCLLLARRDARGVALFLLANTLGIVAAYYAFLKALKFPTEVWYYLVTIALVTVASDVLISRALRSHWSRVFRLVVITLAIAFSLPGIMKAVDVRMTNLDLVAAQLNGGAVEGDLIVLHPWFCDASFTRYYRGKAELRTLPPLADMHLQRLDLVKEQIARADPIAPVRSEIEATLRAGYRVWLVGPFIFAAPPQPPPKLPHAGEGPEGWRAAPYMAAYGMEIAYLLQFHAGSIVRSEVPTDRPVNPFENLPVWRVQGWR